MSKQLTNPVLGTLVCIICGRPATIYGGHVHMGQYVILAGCCPVHGHQNHHDLFKAVARKDCAGCYGPYVPLYGTVET